MLLTYSCCLKRLHLHLQQLSSKQRALTSPLCAQASSSTIAATVDSLSEQLDLGRMFRSAPQGASYSLRGIICYFSHHYQVCICGLLASWLADWLTCLLAYGLACLLACWLAGWLAG